MVELTDVEIKRFKNAPEPIFFDEDGNVIKSKEEVDALSGGYSATVELDIEVEDSRAEKINKVENAALFLTTRLENTTNEMLDSELNKTLEEVQNDLWDSNIMMTAEAYVKLLNQYKEMKSDLGKFVSMTKVEIVDDENANMIGANISVKFEKKNAVIIARRGLAWIISIL